MVVADLLPAPVQERLWSWRFARAGRRPSWLAGRGLATFDRRDLLAGSCGRDSRSVLVLGCGDGSIIAALAEDLPDAIVVGVDASGDVLAPLVERIPKTRNACLRHVDRPGRILQAPELRDGLDALVLSGVLPYLGGERGIQRALSPLASALGHGSRVVMIDSVPNADQLHRSAARALDVPVVLSRHPRDPAGAFALTVAALPVPLLAV